VTLPFNQNQLISCKFPKLKIVENLTACKRVPIVLALLNVNYYLYENYIISFSLSPKKENNVGQ